VHFAEQVKVRQRSGSTGKIICTTRDLDSIGHPTEEQSTVILARVAVVVEHAPFAQPLQQRLLIVGHVLVAAHFTFAEF
jgi:hypothetical protein